MANWSNPQLTSTYTNFLAEVKDRDVDLALQFDGTTSTNIPTNAIRWDSSANRWKKWSGSVWGELTATYALTALTTTGTITGSSTISGTALIPTGSTVPSNGIYLPSTNNVAISTNGTGRLFIDANGNVGVGTGSPSNYANFVTLALADTSGAEIDFIKGSTIQGFIYNAGDIFYAGGSTSVPIALLAGGSERLRITSTGALNFVGAGTAGSTQAVSFSGSAPVNSLVVDASGNLGLGVTPSAWGSNYVVLQTSNGGAFWSSKSGSPTVITSANASFDGSSYKYLANNAATLAIQSGGQHIWYTASSGTAGDPITFTQAMTLDASGRLLVGTANQYSGISGQLINTATAGVGAYGGLAITTYSASTGIGAGSIITLDKSNSNTLGTNAAVANNDQLGILAFRGADGGSSFRDAAYIQCFVDGAVSGGGAADMPGRLVFSTTADGTYSPTPRFTLNRVGDAVFSNTSAVYPATDNAATIGGSSNRWSTVYAVNGTIQTSDQRAKTDIADAQLGSAFIKSLRPVSYKWIEGGQRDSGQRDEENNYIYESVPGQRTHWGFIAQEVKQAVDDAGVDFGGWVLTDKDNPDSQQALRYDQFIAPLTKALQEAIAKIETLEAKVAALEAA